MTSTGRSYSVPVKLVCMKKVECFFSKRLKTSMSFMKKQRPENASNFARYEALSVTITHMIFNYA